MTPKHCASTPGHQSGRRVAYRPQLLAGCAVLLATSLPPGAAVPPDALSRIEQAIPTQAVVAPRQPRRLLVYDGNVGYGGHPSAAYANEAFRLMGEKTGAFGTVVSRDPQVFQADSLKSFDAVFLNNTVGNLFTDPTLRQNLVEFVVAGGGLLGVHGTSVAFTQWPGAVEDWPEFGLMIGGRGANHRDNDERVCIRLDDPEHPLNRVWGGQSFEYRDEFFRVHEPYSRARVRVLLSFDTERTDMNQGAARGQCVRADNDYAIAWIRSYGRGRTFYCTIAHNPYVFWDTRMLHFYLGAIQFALGDLEVPTTPSSHLSPPARSRERLGWRLLGQLDPNPATSLAESMNLAARNGAWGIVAWDGPVGPPAPAKRFGPGLTPEERAAVRVQLDTAGVRLVAAHVREVPTDETGWRGWFQFARTMGIDTLITPAPARWHLLLSDLCDKHNIQVAIPAGPQSPLPGFDTLHGLNQAQIAFPSPRLGFYVDLPAWRRAGAGRDGIAVVEALGRRLLVTSVARLEPADARWLEALRVAQHRPLLLVNAKDPTDDVGFLDRLALQFHP